MGWNDVNVWARRAVAAAAAAALLGGGYGGYAWIKEQTPGDRLAEACNGMLPVDAVLALTGTTAGGFGGGDLELTSNAYDVSAGVSEPDGLPVACRANDLQMRIETASGSGSAFDAYTFHRHGTRLPIPLTGGWSGFLVAADEQELGATVLLDCPNWDRRTGAGVLVTVERGDTDSGDASVRRGVARLAAAIAERAARHTGCAGDPGGSIGQLASPGAADPVDAERADGTCKGVASHPTVRETPARTAPVEFCALGDSLQLRAYYGPFVRGEGDERYGDWERPSGTSAYAVWGSAACGGALGDAVFAARPAEDSGRDLRSAPLTPSEYADLRHFAEASAQRHDCSAPELPAAPRD
ncbi:hypothetical protein FZ103_23445 [Streptomonospora sp. PA3]|uniref:hypothetical protein n=1 Tax=Streptomonospora sp. PA3 TaxID=2607326 RepID=UPI0012DDC40C|nr:hypothetical protein [Streptomonospora sp. PA3]MUL44079.1 hypothetical protein [Streptomonospora sp. PA3]